MIGDRAVLGSGVAGGDDKIVGLAGSQAGDGGRSGGAGIEGLGIRAGGSAVIDVVPDDGGIGIGVPGQGDTLSSGLGDAKRAQQERSGAQPQQRAMPEGEGFKSRRNAGRKEELCHPTILQ